MTKPNSRIIEARVANHLLNGFFSPFPSPFFPSLFPTQLRTRAPSAHRPIPAAAVDLFASPWRSDVARFPKAAVPWVPKGGGFSLRGGWSKEQGAICLDCGSFMLMMFGASATVCVYFFQNLVVWSSGAGCQGHRVLDRVSSAQKGIQNHQGKDRSHEAPSFKQAEATSFKQQMPSTSTIVPGSQMKFNRMKSPSRAPWPWGFYQHPSDIRSPYTFGPPKDTKGDLEEVGGMKSPQEEVDWSPFTIFPGSSASKEETTRLSDPPFNNHGSGWHGSWRDRLGQRRASLRDIKVTSDFWTGRTGSILVCRG